jgi:thiamine-phosphate pyrophosphorylase
MHQMSPGVERAVAAARAWAERLGGGGVRLTHYLLALLEEDEGRAAVLLERAGLSVSAVRDQVSDWREAPAAPPDDVLFNAARSWSIAHRHDPEFLTDALFLAVLRANAQFENAAQSIGLNSHNLERILCPSPVDHNPPAETVVERSAVFAQPNATDEVDAARIVDVNLNRAREALRVLEDHCRFVLNDAFLTNQFKDMRHSVALVSSRIPPALLATARETLQDVGTTITVAGEYVRSSPAQVAQTNCKRLQESLRSLEEFGKIFAADIGREVEALRYRTYTLDKALSVRARHQTQLLTATLYVLLTGSQCKASLDWTIERAAAGGVQIVQLREKSLPDREWLARARDVRRWTRQAGVLFIVNDRPDIARLCEADGVHLGQDDLSVSDARRIVGADAIIGVSTHSLEQVSQAVLDGADYIGVGPVFPSQTKAFDHLAGLEFVRAATAETTLPAFALGGINTGNIADVVAAGARRVAVSAAIACADDPERAARGLRAAFDPA